MRIVFCADPLRPREPDDAYADEVAAVRQAGVGIEIISYETLVNEEDAERAVRLVLERTDTETGIYRGWMLRAPAYALLYDALARRGLRLINDPDAYRTCHELPASYDAIAPLTPRTVWMETDGPVSIEAIMDLLRPFEGASVVVKDFVKSQKNAWQEACFIPSAADRSSVERVVRRFLQLQGDDLYGGLVFREFVELAPAGTHTRSAMPLTQEFRIFVLDGEPFYTVEYWDEAEYQGTPPLEPFRAAMERVRSRFYTMDVARRRDGDWMIVELGDGQVAGLPERADPIAFYRALVDRLGR